MKRTKENWLFGHPEDRSEISGLRKFDGEDLHYQERKKAQQETQKRWLEEQKAEKERRKQQEEEEERMYAFQTIQANRMRGMLEDELENKKRTMQASTRDTNIQLHRERMDKEKRERETKLRAEDDELDHQATIRKVPGYVNPLE
jgi:acetyl/propionyl-CoA carboxylase alpha subunit